MPNDYPPQFTESSLTSLLGEINTLSGSEPNVSSASSSSGVQTASAHISSIQATSQQLSALAAEAAPTPVVVTGTQSPVQAHFPGLRELMISAAIGQLAEQIPLTAINKPLRDRIAAAARELHRAGANRALQGTGREAAQIA